MQGIIYRTFTRLHPLLPAPPIDMYMYVYMHMRRDMPGLREPMVLWALKPFGPWPYKHVEYFGPAGPPPIAKSPKGAHVLFVFSSQLL